MDSSESTLSNNALFEVLVFAVYCPQPIFMGDAVVSSRLHLDHLFQTVMVGDVTIWSWLVVFVIC